MLDLALAMKLKDAGLRWTPTPGDRFVVPVADMEQEVFILSNVIADVHDFEGGSVIGFNGTTEWALDSIDQRDVVWLPREEQLRELLGDAFLTLEQVPGGYAVTVASAEDGAGASGDGGDSDPTDEYGSSQTSHTTARFVDIDAERTYARAVLARLTPGS